MKDYQFEVVDEDTRQPLDELTPMVTAATLTEAMQHPIILEWCKQKNARIYKVVGR